LRCSTEQQCCCFLGCGGLGGMQQLTGRLLVWVQLRRRAAAAVVGTGSGDWVSRRAGAQGAAAAAAQ
jgi:transcriptional regulator GlxA family with amidase domain